MSVMTVFCDNYGCMFIDECGFCDCDKLSIVGGVCEGSYHSGRNVTDAELDHIEDKSRWYELFGTPERAARTLRYGKQPICAGCALLDECDKMPDEEQDTCLLIDHDALLEWLRGESE